MYSVNRPRACYPLNTLLHINGLFGKILMPQVTRPTGFKSICMYLDDAIGSDDFLFQHVVTKGTFFFVLILSPQTEALLVRVQSQSCRPFGPCDSPRWRPPYPLQNHRPDTHAYAQRHPIVSQPTRHILVITLSFYLKWPTVYAPSRTASKMVLLSTAPL